MKKLFMATLLSVTVAASAFAKDTKKVNTAAAGNFKSEYKKASDVTWTARENFVKATFTLNNEKMEAFYNETGEKIATSKAISIDELPTKAKRAITKRLDGYTIKEAIEFEGVEESAYFISAENEKESVIIKVDNANGLSVFKVTRK